MSALVTRSRVLPLRALRSRTFLPGLGKVGRQRSFEQQKIVRYPVTTIYQAVSAVDQYSEFLPWCMTSSVLERQMGEAGPLDASPPSPAEERLKTSIEVGISSMSAHFDSTVTLVPNARVNAVSEPNKYLENLSFTWTFAPIGEQVTPRP